MHAKVEIDHSAADWHEWVFLGGWRDIPVTVKRDAIGRAHPKARRDWLVLSCNNTECPARGLVRMDFILDSMQAVLPVPADVEIRAHEGSE